MINEGQFVQIDYTGKFEDGEVFDTSEGRTPLEFKAGAGMVIPGLDKAVIGMELNEEKEIVIKPEEACVGQRRHADLAKCLARRLAVTGCKRRLRGGASWQHIARCQKSVIREARRIVGQERVAVRGFRDDPLYLSAAVLDLGLGIDADPNVETAPGRHGRGPVATFHLAHHEVQGMLILLVERVFFGIPARLQIVKGAGDFPNRLYGIEALARIGGIA